MTSVLFRHDLKQLQRSVTIVFSLNKSLYNTHFIAHQKSSAGDVVGWMGRNLYF